MTNTASAGFNIAAVERDTGLSKDVLRVWERRYGFPAPGRDANGERVYPPEQVERLRAMRRLMDLGHRPGKLMRLPLEALQALPPRRRAAAAPEAAPDDGSVAGFVERLRRHDARGFQAALQHRLGRQGLQRFVTQTIAPLARAIGTEWESGQLAVFEEHLFTEATERLLRQAIGSLAGVREPPRVLLTSAPDEPHVLGLLMVEALLALESADCVPLGTRTPLPDIVRAAAAHRTDVVGLSFSRAFPARRVAALLDELRATLPAATALWAGGEGVLRLTPPAGVLLLPTLEAATAALADWRAHHPAAQRAPLTEDLA